MEQTFGNPADHGFHEDLELYVMGRLAPELVDRIEEHLLVCEPCRAALDETAIYCAALRKEFAAAPVRSRPGWRSAPVFAFTVVVLLLAVAGWFLTRDMAPSVPLATIQLTAMRGDMPAADRARETEIRLTDAVGFQGVAELVDESGGSIWKGSLAAGGALRINKPLGSGAYFVRLYDAGRLVREYGFRVR
jgi:hypothetical protein